VKPPQNILLIRFKAIGDVVLTLPAVHAVRENFPGAHITFFTVRENAPLLQGFREVDEVIALDRAELKNPLRAAPEFFRLLRRLRAGKFSIVIDLQGYGETAWLTRLTGARERWGTVYGRGRKWAYTRGLERNEAMHPADWNLFLLRECGLKTGEIKNQFHLPEDALAAAKKIFVENKLDLAKPALFIQPFTSSPHKNWRLENYLAVARHWRAGGVQVLFGGGPGDLAALAPARAENFPMFAGVPLLVTGGLMQLSTLVLGGDTGMLHLAIAEGKRALMLVHNFSPGSPILFQHREWVMVAPQKNNLDTITVEAVIAETGKIFNPPAGNVSC
jgi:ADP-heptose:LPS heptosyltransferase